MYQHISIKDLRPALPRVLKRVDTQLERYIISKHGEPMAVLLSIDDFESLIETLNEQEDKENLKRIRQGIKEAKTGRTVDWQQVKKKYNL